MLSEIKKIFNSQKTISLYELSSHFDVQNSAMETMLEVFIRKGKLKKKALEGCNGHSCSSCSEHDPEPSQTILYEWY